MDGAELRDVRIAGGVWQARLRREGRPDLWVSHLGEPVAGLEVAEAGPGDWSLRLPLPVERIADGVQTFVVQDRAGAVVGRIVLVAGQPLADDLRAEIALLRAELDLLGRAFRRHCAEAT